MTSETVKPDFDGRNVSKRAKNGNYKKQRSDLGFLTEKKSRSGTPKSFPAFVDVNSCLESNSLHYSSSVNFRELSRMGKPGNFFLKSSFLRFREVPDSQPQMCSTFFPFNPIKKGNLDGSGHLKVQFASTSQGLSAHVLGRAVRASLPHQKGILVFSAGPFLPNPTFGQACGTENIFC